MTINIQPVTMFRTPDSMEEIQKFIENCGVTGADKANMNIMLMMCYNYFATMINLHQAQDQEVIELFAEFTRGATNGGASADDALEMLVEFAEYKRSTISGKH